MCWLGDHSTSACATLSRSMKSSSTSSAPRGSSRMPSWCHNVGLCDPTTVTALRRHNPCFFAVRA
jgi:hypothetical protein